MSPGSLYSRRRFLKQTFAYSAAAALASPASAILGCGSGMEAVSTTSSHLLMLGDWGSSGSITAQTAVAASMQAYVTQKKYTIGSLLMLGDNFYGDLTGGVANPRWSTQFEQMYPTSLCTGPAFAIPGNHDYEAAPMAKYPVELAYAASNPGTRWTMPSQYYRFTYPAVDPLLTVIALDSNVAIPGRPAGGSFYVMSDDNWQQQLIWLEAELAKPLTTPYLAIMGHHPVYSDGPHGDHPVLLRDWDPLLRQYNVHLYLGGHDHDMQHLEFSGHPTSFFLSGGGGAGLYPITTDPSKRGPMAQSIHGFSHIEVNKQYLTLRHLDQSGNIIHTFRKYQNGAVTFPTS